MQPLPVNQLLVAIRAFRPWSLLLFGTTMGLLLHLGHHLSLELLLALFACLFLWGVAVVRVGQHALLCRLMLLLYIMPFTTCLGYLNETAYDWPIVSSERAHAYAVNLDVVENMLTIGTIGLCGMLAGMLFVRRSDLETDTEPDSPRRTLSAVPYCLATVVATAASYIGSPTKTIFQASYENADSYSLASQLNLNSANLLSYAMLMVLRIDAERDVLEGRNTRWKFVLLAVVSLLIIVYFQLLRGNRTFVGFAFGLMAMYVTGPQRKRGEPFRAFVRMLREQRRRLLKLAPVAAVLLFGLISIGYLRFEAVGASLTKLNPIVLLQQGLRTATWTSILGTNLGMAGEFTDGTIQWRWGETWVHYAMSLPPGIVSSSLGIPRPIDGPGDPRVWYGEFSGGGVHTNVVPFCNLGALGVLFSHALYGFWLARIERGNHVARFWPRLLYSAMFITSFLWVWYGDINLIRAMMIAYLLRWAYALAMRVRMVWNAPAQPSAAPEAG